MFRLPFNPDKPIIGTASTVIDKAMPEVFAFIGEQFFANYPKWAQDVIHFEPLDGKAVAIGAKARQIRLERGEKVVSVFQIGIYQPLCLLGSEGVTYPYRDSYQLSQPADAEQTQLTYRFELLNLEVFMRPFEKLIRIAIEDGAETTVDNIKTLLMQ